MSYSNKISHIKRSLLSQIEKLNRKIKVDKVPVVVELGIEKGDVQLLGRIYIVSISNNILIDEENRKWKWENVYSIEDISNLFDAAGISRNYYFNSL